MLCQGFTDGSGTDGRVRLAFGGLHLSQDGPKMEAAFKVDFHHFITFILPEYLVHNFGRTYTCSRSKRKLRLAKGFELR
ncbi:hypothetical protein CSA56_03690 [candidate division KSB3 bacterium]|uniref:Uncharacterized protein n=1 Tax=candidate division KSB3 bacterium TaxID=2044937 RepID=A0A2G6KIX0_9BACT|nr:MAG: hypothetical protein CSA56_03690 [candidate division KSB3 bacterium]